jgi:hypothetical protein
MALGGIIANLTVPRLASGLTTDAAFLAVAVVVLLGALACLRLPRATVQVPPAEAGGEAPARSAHSPASRA